MKGKSYATLKRKLDKVFSAYIRRRSEVGGLVRCVSCGVERHWTEIQCGHFVSRVHLATRWDENNCWPQCPRCNVLLRGNPSGYARFLAQRFGESIFATLDEKKKKTVKYTRADLQDLIDHYLQKTALL